MTDDLLLQAQKENPAYRYESSYIKKTCWEISKFYKDKGEINCIGHTCAYWVTYPGKKDLEIGRCGLIK